MNNQPYLDRIPDGYFLIREFLHDIAPYVDFNDVRVVFDIGSRDLQQTIEFKTVFPRATVFAFEANPEAYNGLCIPALNALTDDMDAGIVLCNYAATDTDGPVALHAIDMDASPNKNIGASSLLRVMPSFTREQWRQKRITVPGTRIDTFCRRDLARGYAIDLVWLDVQGVELSVLRGFGNYLLDVKALCTEAGTTAYYQGHELKPQIDEYLDFCGFVELISRRSHEYEVDGTYLNRRYYRDSGADVPVQADA